MRLKHKQIEVFRAVMLAGSVTRAAEQLHTSQPAVSRDLARLAQLVGFALFDRRSGRLYPTARGLALFDEIERSFTGLQSIVSRAISLRDFREGELRLAALPALCDTLLAQACARFAARRSEVVVKIVALESPELERSLAEQRFDLGLVEHATAPAGTTLEPLLADEERLLVPPNHPLANRRRVALTELGQWPLVAYGVEDPYRRRLDAMFDGKGIQRRVVAEASTASSLCALVREGLGVAIVNSLSANQMLALGLRSIRLSPTVSYEVGLVKPILRSTNPLTDEFAEVLRSCVRRRAAP